MARYPPLKIKSGRDLLFRGLAPQVPSAQESLTSVFGMGTGVTSPLYLPETLFNLIKGNKGVCFFKTTQRIIIYRLSPRSISTGQLKMLPSLHFRPINQVIFLGSYFQSGMGDLILEKASRLDAFSAYPFRT